jgi:hypothetical protein
VIGTSRSFAKGGRNGLLKLRYLNYTPKFKINKKNFKNTAMVIAVFGYQLFFLFLFLFCHFGLLFAFVNIHGSGGIVLSFLISSRTPPESNMIQD